MGGGRKRKERRVEQGGSRGGEGKAGVEERADCTDCRAGEVWRKRASEEDARLLAGSSSPLPALRGKVGGVRISGRRPGAIELHLSQGRRALGNSQPEDAQTVQVLPPP